jgi:hypothetical protein
MSHNQTIFTRFMIVVPRQAKADPDHYGSPIDRRQTLGRQRWQAAQVAPKQHPGAGRGPANAGSSSKTAFVILMGLSHSIPDMGLPMRWPSG